VTTTLEQLVDLFDRKEDEHLEFKEAKNHFDFEKLVKYCAALANEGGGRIILGVTDKRPRRVVGTQEFRELERTKAGLIERLRLRIDADAIEHSDGRVVVFDVPGRPVGFPIQYKGAYWMRGGEDLVPMTQDMLQRVFSETQPDFSADVCRAATLADLDAQAIEKFRSRWVEKSRRTELRNLSVERLLEDAELTIDGAVTFAALILLGSRRALGRHLAQAEVVFEYRSEDASIAYQQRKEYREGFLVFEEELWNTINLRNDLYSLQDGLFRREIPTFNESAVREAILNAVSHRDYRLGGSVFVKQYPKSIRIDSPGGFPAGVTAENILERQSPRNRRLADALARCGLVERSGQGADRMFSAAVSEGKLPPDFSRSDDFLVSVVLHGRVQDEGFLRFLERLGAETQHLLSLDDLIVLDAVHREMPIPERARQRVSPLMALGALERPSPKKLTLSRRYYSFVGKRGEYTRRRGLDRETNKALLRQHIERNAREGSPLGELNQVLPGMKASQVQNLLRELKRDGVAHPVGRTKAARWYPGPPPVEATDD
jgi:ATP-dependent DNA helicase RecG